MAQTLCEKIIARYCGRDQVAPGEYVTLTDFAGPISYSFRGFNVAATMEAMLKGLGLSGPAKPENCIINCDHNVPPQNEEDARLLKEVQEAATRLGISKVYAREGIGHVVNVEKGDLRPGIAFVHMDPQATNAGGVGAFYTNGGRLGGNFVEAYATGEITLCVPGTIRVEIDGDLPDYVTSRDVWMTVLNDLGPDGAHGMIIEFGGTAVAGMSIAQRMILCGNAGFAGADGAITQSDAMTQDWFCKNVGIEVEAIGPDVDAVYARVLHYDGGTFKPMVTYPPEVFTSKPAAELSHVEIDQCIIGTCAGGTLEDIRAVAAIVKGRRVHERVRFVVSPVTQRVYAQAADEGLVDILTDAGVRVVASSCDVCVGVVAPLAEGEVGLSQQTMNVPGRSGSMHAHIYLANAETIAVSAITGRITDPQAFDMALA